jgi:diguanylate cyclase (GGDEF)-like protein
VSIVTRIVILIGLTLLVVASGELINGFRLRQNRLGEVRSDTVQLARIAELDMVRILEGAHQLLATLAKLPVEHGWDRRACSVLESTANADFEYDHLSAVDRNGLRQCSSTPTMRLGTAVPDQELVDRVLASGRFSVGLYGRGVVSRSEVIRVGYPVTDESGTIIGAVYAGINLTWLNTAISQWQLGAKASIDITDRNGILIARHPEPQLVGQRIAENLQPFLSGAQIGTAEVKTNSGGARLYGFVPVDVGPSDGLAVLVGRDYAEIMADLESAIWANFIIILVGLVVSGLFASMYVRRFLDQPFKNLLSAAARWSDGDWSVRPSSASGIPEFDRLSASFDKMAEEVSLREAKITRLARYDTLTGLANRRVFLGALQRVIARSQQEGASFAVFCIDLDHFKEINDTLGHPAGDRLLKVVARRLQDNTRASDTVARLGGDEFAVIASDLRQPGDATVLAEKLLTVIGEPISIQGIEVRSEGSIGIALNGPSSDSPDVLLSHADVALYRAKDEGRGIYRFFTDSMDEEVKTQFVLGAELRQAIAGGQLFLVYQPQIDVRGGRLMGVEALVRWQHPERGVLAPGQFIRLAEKNGLIGALGRWVMREACDQMQRWTMAGVAPPLIAINVSAIQFKRARELESDINAVLAETGIPSQAVELELTESAIMDASRENNDALHRIRQAGIRIAIDDFGTGYSSLDYLRRFPVDRIKIAQQFMFDLTEDAGDAIVRAAIALAQELKIDVVVEGVETANQLRRVMACGGSTVQGYYVSRPISAEEMTRFLKSGAAFVSALQAAE